MQLEFKTKDLKPLIKATFPKYRKRKVYVRASTKIMFYDLNWSGGTKSEYRACTIAGKPIQSNVNMGLPAPWNNPYEGLEIDIPLGAVIAEGGYFCGKERVITFHVHPDNMPKVLNETN